MGFYLSIIGLILLYEEDIIKIIMLIIEREISNNITKKGKNGVIKNKIGL